MENGNSSGVSVLYKIIFPLDIIENRINIPRGIVQAMSGINLPLALTLDLDNNKNGVNSKVPRAAIKNPPPHNSGQMAWIVEVRNQGRVRMGAHGCWIIQWVSILYMPGIQAIMVIIPTRIICFIFHG